MFAPVHPDLEGIAAERFRSLAGQLKRMQELGADSDSLDALCRDEVAWISTTNGLNGCREKYEASVRLLTDLAKLRWRIVEDGFGIELAAPSFRTADPSMIAEYKKTVRQELKSQIDLQLDGKSVREFVARMENPAASTKRRPVTDLIADGREVRARLLAAFEASGGERKTLCRSAIQPYLQLVESGATDKFTGISLSDIWRYFRYTWSIPATNVPGRNLFYLIRDAAHPSHAVMGITALSNAPLALKDRDDCIGWTAAATEAHARELSACPEDEARGGLLDLFETLEANLHRGLESVSHDGLVSLAESSQPTDAVVQRLRRRAAEFASQRQDILREIDSPLMVQELEEIEYGIPAVSDEVLALEEKVFGDKKMDAARRALTAKKRAGELARLLQARMVLRRYRDDLLDPAKAAGTYRQENVATAVNAVWIAAKNARAGTSMLEITVCGAVRPYSQILGGKLAALLMLSPEVSDDYTRRYGKSVSIISSMMKNEPVVKDSRLVFLGTTSLYLHGASQYNRLRLPAGIISPEQQEIRYAPMGQTGGFGTVQFPTATVEAIERVVTTAKGYREVNSVFGEGRSPKLRKLRTGLDALGFSPEILLQHHQPRIIYGIELYPGAGEFLRSGRENMPDFVLRPEDFRDATRRIADFWSDRWLASRLDHRPLMGELEQSPGWTLGMLVPTAKMPAAAKTETEPPPRVDNSQAHKPDLRLWRSLASAGHDSCSDGLSPADLDRLHVPSPLENFLLTKVSEGYSLVLTGNAGDGKTHLLKKLEPALTAARADVDLDATATMRKGSVAPILDRWRRAIDAGRPYCLAANEYPLHLLMRDGRKSLPRPLHDELCRQNRERLACNPLPEPLEQAQGKLLVVDLSLRNPLTSSFVKSALNRMLADPAIVAHATEGEDADFSWNHAQLSKPRVQERLGSLFQRLAEEGFRSTIRELWIVLARMLFGDGSSTGDAPAGSPRAWYSTRLWATEQGAGRFQLVQLLNAHADPAACSHPQWDWRLEHASEMESADWLAGIPALDLRPQDPKVSLFRFQALKRRFYFEHARGDESLDLASPHGQVFARLLSGARTADEVFREKILRAINHAYCPRTFAGSDRELYLWFSHRYHEQPTRCYLANRSIPAALFKFASPVFPPDYRALSTTIPTIFFWRVRLRMPPSDCVSTRTSMRHSSSLPAGSRAISPRRANSTSSTTFSVGFNPPTSPRAGNSSFTAESPGSPPASRSKKDSISMRR